MSLSRIFFPSCTSPYKNCRITLPPRTDLRALRIALKLYSNSRGGWWRVFGPLDNYSRELNSSGPIGVIMSIRGWKEREGEGLKGYNELERESFPSLAGSPWQRWVPFPPGGHCGWTRSIWIKFLKPAELQVGSPSLSNGGGDGGVAWVLQTPPTPFLKPPSLP